jgi:hypothetical protein
MRGSSRSHKVSFLLLAVWLVASLASAGEVRTREARPLPPEARTPVSFLHWLREGLAFFGAKEGAEFDPFGLHVNPPSPTPLAEVPAGTTSAQGEEGAGFDPFG